MRKAEKPCHRDLFVDTPPTDSDTLPDQFPLLALSFGGMVEARKPLKGGTDLTPIGKTHV